MSEAKVAALYIRVSTLDQAREGYSLARPNKPPWKPGRLPTATPPPCTRTQGSVAKTSTTAPPCADASRRKGRQNCCGGRVGAIKAYPQRGGPFTPRGSYWHPTVWGLVSHTEGFDTSTPTGRAMMGLLGVFAQMEREITAERVRAAMEERASQGKRTCHCVLGYDLSGPDDLVPNQAEAEMVRYIYSKYLEHRSLSAVAELCRIKGYHGKRGREMCAWSVRIILSRPIYAGYNSWHGQLIKGSHQPLISVADFNRVQRLLGNPATGRKARRAPVLIKK